MSETYQIQQPEIKRDYIRVKAMALIWRNDQLLLEDIHETNGTLIGFRPLGGSIEFGEKSWEALEREFMEELGEDITIKSLFTVYENMYTWNGKPGHEIVFLYETELLSKESYTQDTIERMDISGHELVMKTAVWRNPFDLPDGLPLFPLGLVDVLKDKRKTA